MKFSANQLGVFEMSESGLQAVSNPSEMFLSEHDSDSEILAGLAVAVIVDGSRAFVVEIQVCLFIIMIFSGKKNWNFVSHGCVFYRIFFFRLVF